MDESNEPPNTTPPDASHTAAETEIADLRAELDATRDRLLRCLADQENVRRQARRDRETAIRFAASQFAGDLLETADNLERAIASVPEDNRADSTISMLLTGIEATHRALLDAFARHGLRRLNPIGERFDPHLHKASFEVADEYLPPGSVASVLQPGYVHHERLLRPALVGVTKAAGKIAEDNETNA
jgi:molecular chaperone GrpE